ncbi:hypothetical protein VDGD_20773 [Verticillium dahliae]|nr:hypothetical protein VDGD_20773 [Verticillium dahliae]
MTPFLPMHNPRLSDFTSAPTNPSLVIHYNALNTLSNAEISVDTCASSNTSIGRNLTVLTPQVPMLTPICFIARTSSAG